ncbi:winged helix-turn-helix transcriptional regulator [Acaryochloris marina NIES-2412]|uniref:winged helix-turn-helix transcriptional regulator n=1 Tax=Acaryochloris marina TaxID=155978 RepID=UPI00405976EE
MDKDNRDRRSGCPISYSLDIFGDRWTLLILRDLLLGQKRHYRELLTSEEGIATNILSSRLKRLEAQGIIIRQFDPKDRRQCIYEVTKKGLDLLPILLEIAAWGATYDTQTAAPDGFVQEFRSDRDGVIARYGNHIQKD